MEGDSLLCHSKLLDLKTNLHFSLLLGDVAVMKQQPLSSKTLHIQKKHGSEIHWKEFIKEFSKIKERGIFIKGETMLKLWTEFNHKKCLFELNYEAGIFHSLLTIVWVIIYQRAPPASLQCGVWSTKFKLWGCITYFTERHRQSCIVSLVRRCERALSCQANRLYSCCQ